MRGVWVRRIAGFICLAIIGVLVVGGIVMLLWNALMPAIFHLPTITFLQALGLLLLTKILFSGFRGGGPKPHWKNKVKQKWMNMTPEEREKFRQEWGRRCRPENPRSRETHQSRENPVSPETHRSRENPRTTENPEPGMEGSI